MKDKIIASYKFSLNFYDDVLTRRKWWSRLYMILFWNNVDDSEIVRTLLSYIPNDFKGKMLDVPVGTAVFTSQKYSQLSQAQIYCVDYSYDMLFLARKRFEQEGIQNVIIQQGDVGKLPYENEIFDIVLSMNGFHAFPNKEKAYSEIHRVLKKGGAFIACFYIRGNSKLTDWLVRYILSRKGWFTPPFEDENSQRYRLEQEYQIVEYHVEGSIVYFKAIKK